MVWKACQFRFIAAIVPVGKDNAQYFGGLYRVFSKGFVKIPNTEQ